MASFRPLIGVNFCKPIKEVYPDLQPEVSVPLSGLISVNGFQRRNHQWLVLVSVPLSGLISVNNIMGKFDLVTDVPFPSPYRG